MMEATAVSPEGRITPYDLGLWTDSKQRHFAIVSFIKEQGATPQSDRPCWRKACSDQPWKGG